jgi:nuclease S1
MLTPVKIAVLKHQARVQVNTDQVQRWRHRSCYKFTLTLLVILHTASPASAWGRLGHRVISRLAEKELTPPAKAAIADLLEPGESLADASTWADEIRGRMRHTAPWHYVDVPLDEPKYDAKFSADDSKHGCVVEKINEFRKVIGDKSTSIEDRRFALRFLLHCLQDMHQPCHVGDNHDKGGNDTQVRWFDRGCNMHRVWGGGIIEHAGSTEDYWLNDLAILDRRRAIGAEQVWDAGLESAPEPQFFRHAR